MDEAIEATTVVSLIGEAWSPKIPPEIAAPKNNGMGKFKVTAIGIAIGIIMANVPQLEPTEKAIKAEQKKISGARRTTGTEACAIPAMYGPVPRSLATSPSVRAKRRIAAMGNKLPAPSMKSCIIRLTLAFLFTSNINQQTNNAADIDHNIAVDPDPFIKSPSPVI